MLFFPLINVLKCQQLPDSFIEGLRLARPLFERAWKDLIVRKGFIALKQRKQGSHQSFLNMITTMGKHDGVPINLKTVIARALGKRKYLVIIRIIFVNSA